MDATFAGVGFYCINLATNMLMLTRSRLAIPDTETDTLLSDEDVLCLSPLNFHPVFICGKP